MPMKAWGSVFFALVSCLSVSAIGGPPESFAAPAGGHGTHISRRPPPERLAMVTLGIFGSYARHDFPRTNEWLGQIVAEIEKTHPGITLNDLETDLGVSGYLQVLIWEGIGFRLGVQWMKGRTTTMEPGGFGPIRAEIEARSSPLVVSYSLVKELWLGRFWFAGGAGVEQYRWDMDWKFYPIGEAPLEDWTWTGRGTGGHGFLETGVIVAGLHLLVGAAYHKGTMDMDAEVPVTTELIRYPRHFEEDVEALQAYGGIVFDIF